MTNTMFFGNIIAWIVILGVVYNIIYPIVYSNVIEGYDQVETVDRTSILSSRGLVRDQSSNRDKNEPQGHCDGGPPSDVFGNCKPLCRGQPLIETDGVVRELSSIMKCPENGQSNTHMLCPSNDTCTDGPWYKTEIPKDDRPSQTRAQPHGGVSPEPSGPASGDIDVPGQSDDNSWEGDQSYPGRAQFHGGTHHHHHHYEGGEHRRWQTEVVPASPHLPTSAHGHKTLANQMSIVDGNQCSSSVTGAFSDCGPVAANIPCYELFNN
jgi:hypothetical protein